MASYPTEIELVQCLPTVVEDALFAVAAAGDIKEDVLLDLGKRRADVHERVLRGGKRIPITAFREWTAALAAAIAPVCPPAWMPMAGVVGGGITVEGGARGVRAFFTSKPSEKMVEHVRRAGALAVRALVAVLNADGQLDPDEQDLRAALVASLGLPDKEGQKLLDEAPYPLENLEIPEDLEPKIAREIVLGGWFAAAADGLDPREERIITALGTRLSVRPEDIETARTEARRRIDEQRDVGAAVVEAIRYVHSDEPEHAVLVGKVAARLFLPRRHRMEPLSALQQRATITLANRFRLGRAAEGAVLAASWLSALHTNPSLARRMTLLLRHEEIARDLGADGAGAFVRERLDRIVESQLQVAALAFRGPA